MIMKYLLYLTLSLGLLMSCGNSDSKDNSSTDNDEKVKTTTKSTETDDNRVSGSFTVSVDGKTYKSEQLQDNYCDMNYAYKGEKSFVAVRFKDVNSKDALLLSIYGDESYIENPEGSITSFMFSGQNSKKANIQFLPYDKKGSLASITMLEGNLNIIKFQEGVVEATFKGMGGAPKDVVTKTNLIPFEGELSLKTEHVTKIGK